MKRLLKFFTLVILISSCVNTKYSYNFDKGKSLDFSSGEWILNKPYSYKKIEHLEDVALKGFHSILKDSLFEIEDLRADRLIGVKPPYNPSSDELKDLRMGTDSDFLINYRVEILRDELGSLSSPPPIGTVRRSNEVLVEISIYDLTTTELSSRSSALGKAKLDINEEEHGWDLAHAPGVISRKALTKLIRQYRKNKK